MHLAKCKKLRHSRLSAMTTARVSVGFFYTDTTDARSENLQVIVFYVLKNDGTLDA
jgi:hypothetical protein